MQHRTEALTTDGLCVCGSESDLYHSMCIYLCCIKWVLDKNMSEGSSALQVLFFITF